MRDQFIDYLMAKLHTLFLLQIHRYGRLKGNPELVSHCLGARQPQKAWDIFSTVWQTDREKFNWLNQINGLHKEKIMDRQRKFSHCTNDPVKYLAKSFIHCSRFLLLLLPASLLTGNSNLFSILTMVSSFMVPVAYWHSFTTQAFKSTDIANDHPGFHMWRAIYTPLFIFYN